MRLFTTNSTWRESLASIIAALVLLMRGQCQLLASHCERKISNMSREQASSVVHSAKWRWLLAGLASAVVTVLLFFHVNRDGCWLHWHERSDLLLFGVLSLWLSLLFGLHLGGRIVLLIATLIVGYVIRLPLRSPMAAAEARAIFRLHELQSAVEKDKSRHYRQGYPQKLLEVRSTISVEKYYQFHYVPVTSPDSIVTGFVIEAIPVGRCGCCTRSFAISENNRVYYTLEGRPANRSDPSVD